MNPKKIHKKVEKLRKKAKLSEAIELQRQLCQADDQSVEEWTLLADLAAEAKMADVELATRFCIAKLSRVGPDEWVALAERAGSAGFEKDAVDALFRAADTAALIGEARRAVELCDQVLAIDPSHRPARRIRGLMSARLLRMESMEQAARAREEEDGGEAEAEEVAAGATREEWDEPSQSTITFMRQVVEDNRDVEPGDVRSFREMVAGEWIPPDPVLDAEGRVTPAGFVCAPQRWPSVLDQQCLMFVGNVDQLDDKVINLADPVNLEAGKFVYTQGRKGHLLYCLDQGEVHASRERGFVQDLGRITAGSFFGEVVTIAGFPSTTSVETVTDATLRVLTREKFHAHLREGTQGVEKVISSLRGWYLETVVSICPVFAYCDYDELKRLTDSSRWVTFGPGEVLASQDIQGGLHVIITGVAEVTLQHGDRSVSMGRLSTGDLVGEMDPSPVTITAECTVLAIAIDRELMHQLPEMAQAEMKARFSRCREALREAHRSA